MTEKVNMLIAVAMVLVVDDDVDQRKQLKNGEGKEEEEGED